MMISFGRNLESYMSYLKEKEEKNDLSISIDRFYPQLEQRKIS